MSQPRPFINSHTHIFTHKHVPPFISKQLVPFPLYYLFNIPLLIRLVHYFVHKRKNKWWYRLYKTVENWKFQFNQLTQHHVVTRSLVSLLDILIKALNLVFVVSFFAYYLNFYTNYEYLRQAVIIILAIPIWGRILFVVLSALFFSAVRRMLWWLAQNTFSFLKSWFGPQTTELVQKYLAMAYYADQLNQENVFSRLNELYPNDTRFVILPMDMDYMGAGRSKETYPQQLETLKGLMNSPKKRFFQSKAIPFVAVDPRRIADPTNDFGKETIAALITKYRFSGIKLYPPLGYYPFDKHLLETLLWACENEVPITTHCIRGVIFYRGPKKREWNSHPVFKNSNNEPLELRSYKNSEFCHNFTHPLNYECLFDANLLARVLRHHNDPALNTLFDFNPATDNEPRRNLKNLKICFAHFGGEDEWELFLDCDKGNFEVALHKPDKQFIIDDGKAEQYWHSVSWFSVIYNMMLKYPNVYADLSFTLHDERILNLLKHIMKMPSIADKILFGTDFFVVRQKKTEKVLWTDLKAALGDDAFYQIASTNVERFLDKKTGNGGPILVTTPTASKPPEPVTGGLSVMSDTMDKAE